MNNEIIMESRVKMVVMGIIALQLSVEELTVVLVVSVNPAAERGR